MILSCFGLLFLIEIFFIEILFEVHTDRYIDGMIISCFSCCLPVTFSLIEGHCLITGTQI